MGTEDALNGVNGIRTRQLIAADGIVGRCAQLCERVLLSQGDEADASIVQLHHDCVDWSARWVHDPVLESECEPEPKIIPLNGHEFGKDGLN